MANDNAVDFNKAKEEKDQAKANVEELKNQIEQNLYLKYAIRIISKLALIDQNEDGELVDNYNEAELLEEYRKEALENKQTFISLGEASDDDVQFYYQLFQLGYRTFGAEFFKRMMMNEVNCVYLIKGVWALVQGLENMSEGMAKLDIENRAFKSLELTEEQKILWAKEVNKTPQEFMEELMRQSEELENKNK